MNNLGRIAIAITNIMPLVGILWWDWKPFDVVFLYWLENVIIGIFVVVRMLIKPNNAPLFIFGSLFLAAFFCFHYGFFTFGHGTFVMSIFEKQQEFGKDLSLIGISLELLQNPYLRIALFGLFVGHLVNYLVDYKERKIGNSGEEMMKPYVRIIILHVTIIFGGFLSMMLNYDTAMAFLLVAIKLFFDLKRPKIFNSKKKKDSFLNNPNKISPDASDHEIKQFMRQKLAKPSIKINRQEYQFDSVTAMVASEHYQKSQKILNWVMPKRMKQLYQETIDEMVQAEKLQSSHKIDG